MRSSQIAAAVSGLLRSLPLSLPATLGGAATAMAQPSDATAPVPLDVAIPAQPLAQALAAFAEQTGLQVVYVAGLIRDQQSHEVTAGMRPKEAIAQLLQGTGLRFEFLTARSIRILAAPPRALTSPDTESPSEVIVTANRRTENIQDVPITIQVFSGEQLAELGVATFSQLLKYAPNVSYSGNGPGTGNIYIRGLGSIGTGNQSQATTAPFPNVALYLDDQSMQFPSRNLDVYMVDLERIEILEGPQGTIFGGGAEAGAIRYITNKPKLDVTAGQATAAYGVTTGGAPNSSLNATLNLPLIPDRLAVRGVVFSDRQGGYIANVPGTIALDMPSPSTPGVTLLSPTVSNAALVGRDTNPITWQGLRLSGLYQFNDDWNLLIQQSYQDMDAAGTFYAYPVSSNGAALQNYQITEFAPAYTHDRYESTAWTLSGQVGDLKAVYSGSYMVRHIEGQQDYSSYVGHSVYGAYYACIGPGAPDLFNPNVFPQLAGKKLRCYPPQATWHDQIRNVHQSHELRVSTSDAHRLRGLVGAYWEKFVIDDNMSFNYLDIPQCSAANLSIALAGGPDCVSAVGPLPGVYASDPSPRASENSAFGEDVQRGYRQTALFASVDLDVIPEKLTVSAGTRHFQYDEFEEGSVWEAFTSTTVVLDHPNGACSVRGKCGFPITLSKSESGFRSRANLTWHVTPDVTAYYTYSQGFRPGGFNRIKSPPGQAPFFQASAPYCGNPPSGPLCSKGGSLYGLTNTYQFVERGSYTSDALINNEIGIKSDFLDHRLVLNASLYRVDWNDVQSFALNLVNVCGCATWTNGPNYTVKGAELQVIARLTDALTLQGGGSWNSSNLSSKPCLQSAGKTPQTPNNPTPAGECITVVSGAPYIPLGQLNTPAPYSPPLMFNARLRYDWYEGGYDSFAWIGASHIGAMHNEPTSFPDGDLPVTDVIATAVLRYTIPAYTTYDASVGVIADRWTLQLIGSNLTDVYGPTNISSAQYIKANIPLRPRVLMAQFSYRF